MALLREFAQLDAGATRVPDESTILGFRHFVEAHQLAIQMLASVNAKLINRGLMLKTGTVIYVILLLRPHRTTIARPSVPLRCTRPRRVTNGTTV